MLAFLFIVCHLTVFFTLDIIEQATNILSKSLVKCHILIIDVLAQCQQHIALTVAIGSNLIRVLYPVIRQTLYLLFACVTQTAAEG